MSIQNELLSIIQDVPNFPKEGIIFKDINPLLRNPVAMKKVIAAMSEFARELNVQHIVGIESRGFFFALPLALEMNIPFVAARKKGKLPGAILSESYSLEYGKDSIEIQTDALKKGERYLIVDDVIATGGTAKACSKIIQKSEAIVVGFSFLLEITFLQGRENLLEGNSKIPIQSLVNA
ncbi:adenine phosphoribosyltransferase [Fluviispira multicolorata]|uniref:Adenine phosphoribosyltransferase n=1 Tax=Fluviispira multicolorata TaxID=2654512 RepID=A0A833N6J8_9BACT|nr:adenine phosphoribosyltransferase [Fluviispira multicolorata]KAB8033565.1 adenine phosphoribosyltransferase [Fluviispira multicolorata]